MEPGQGLGLTSILLYCCTYILQKYCTSVFEGLKNSENVLWHPITASDYTIIILYYSTYILIDYYTINLVRFRKGLKASEEMLPPPIKV